MTALWTILGTPLVIDLSHNNPEPIDFAALYADGVRMVIHKATQGEKFVDPMYAVRRKRATDAGMIWEAYHFADASSPSAQADHFRAVATLTPKMRGAIDVEPNKGSSISFAQADFLVAIVDQAQGQRCLRYTGAGFLIPAAIPQTVKFRAGPIWWAKYGPMPTRQGLAPLGIDPANLVLWQETSTARRNGVTGEVDESYWLGTAAELDAYPALPAKGQAA